MELSLIAEKSLAWAVPNATADATEKPDRFITTTVPPARGPDDGETDETTGRVAAGLVVVVVAGLVVVVVAGEVVVVVVGGVARNRNLSRLVRRLVPAWAVTSMSTEPAR